MSQYHSIEQYNIWAKFIINHFIKDEYQQKRLRNDDEFVGNVMRAMMTADEKYNPDKGMSQKSYRIQRAKWYIYKYFNESKKKLEQNNILSTFENKKSGKAFQLIEDKEYISSLFNKAGLTDTQKKCLELYYFEDQTFQEIGNTCNFSKQAAQQNVQSGLRKLRIASGM